MREVLVSLVVALVVGWLALVVALLVARPRGGALAESVRLLPDLVRLVKDLVTDRSQPPSVRWRLVALAAYLALPFDLVPDVIPVVGYADDVVVVLWTLRSVLRRVGVEECRRRWRGTDDGFAALRRLTGV